MIRGGTNSSSPGSPSSSGGRPNVNVRNAANAVLFEAITLIAGMEDADPALVAASTDVLSQYVQALESNAQYLALEGMTAFVLNKPDTLPAVQVHLQTIISAMKSSDISIRRRALDLLYHACDRQHSKEVVSELMRFLLQADYEFREELVLKIAILSERFAPNYVWYVDVIVQLIAEAGESVSDDIWHRVIHITTNHEDIQAHAAKICFEALSHPTWNETTLKLTGYILGEFGHLIADRPGYTPIQQFNLMHSKFYSCSLPTKALLLSTYVKFSNLYPEELAEPIGHVFQDHQDFIDPEIQQRACEYWNLSEFPDPQIITKVLDEMPPFPERAPKDSTSGRPSNLNEEREDSGDDDDFRHNDLSGENSDEDFPQAATSKSSQVPQPSSLAEFLSQPPIQPTSSSAALPISPVSFASANPLPFQPTSSSAALPISPVPLVSANPLPLQPQPSFPALQSFSSLPPTAVGSSAFLPLSPTTSLSPQGSSANLLTPTGHLSLKRIGNDNTFWRNLIISADGVLSENQHLQIGLKSQYSKSAGRIMIYFGNSATAAFDNFLTTIPSCNYLQLQIQPTNQRIEPREQVSQLIQFATTAEFNECPTLHIEFTFQLQPVHLTLPLPIVCSKFVEPLEIGAAEFLHRWKQITAVEKEAIVSFKSSKPMIDLVYVSNVLSAGLHLKVIAGVDPNPCNIVAAGSYFFNQNQSQSRIYVRLESLLESSSFRLSIRTDSAVLTTGIAGLIVDVLGVFSSLVQE